MHRDPHGCCGKRPDKKKKKEILANFREARRALDQARGFYPVRNQSASRYDGRGYGSGKGCGGKHGGISQGDADKMCMRCGKEGRIARNCPQRPGYGKGRGGNRA